jgi:hypothetical protein
MFTIASRKRIALVTILGLLSSALVYVFTHEPILQMPWYLMAGSSLAILLGRFVDSRLDPARPSDRTDLELLLGELGEVFAYALPGAVLGVRLFFPLVDLGSSLKFCFAGAVFGYFVGRFLLSSVNGRFLVTIAGALSGFLARDVSAISILLDTLVAALVLIAGASAASFVLSLRMGNEPDQGKVESLKGVLRNAFGIAIESLIMGFKVLLLVLLIVGGLVFAPVKSLSGVAAYASVGAYGIVLSLFVISLRVLIRFRAAVTDFRGYLLVEKLSWELGGGLIGVGALAPVGQIENLSSAGQFAVYLMIGGAVGLAAGTIVDRVRERFKPHKAIKLDVKQEKERRLAMELSRRLTRDRNNLALQTELAASYARLGRLEQARDELVKVLESDINSPSALDLGIASQLLSGAGQQIAYIAKFFREAGFKVTAKDPARPAFDQTIWWLEGRPDFPSTRFFEQYGGLFIVFLLLDGFVQVGEDVDWFLNQARDGYKSSDPERSLEGRLAFIVLEQAPGAGAESRIITHKLDDKFYLAPIVFSSLKEAVDRQAQENQSCFKEFAKIVRENVGIDDLYDRTKPIREAGDFYGRVDLLGELFRSVQSHSPVALFGINKVGKTSLLFRLQDVCQSSHTVGVYADLKQFARDAKYVFASIVRDLSRQVQSPGDWESFAQAIESGSLPLDAAPDKMLELLSQSGEVRQPIALLFDEWDYLFPTSPDLDDGFEDWLPFLRALSQIASSPWFVPILAGVDTTSLEVQNWKSERNPLLQIFRLRSISLFSRSECDEMVLGIGRQMGLDYDNAALGEMYFQSGGHPFVTRRLCSSTWRRLGRRPGSVAAEAIRNCSAQYVRDATSSMYLEELWQTLMVRERQILRRIAKQGTVERDALLQDVGSEKIRREISMYLDRLTRYSILLADEQGTTDSYRIAIGVFRQWIEANQP